MADKDKYEVELISEQHAFLKQMAESYGLPDESKALRCLINHAIAEPDMRDTIFQEIRCLDC